MTAKKKKAEDVGGQALDGFLSTEAPTTDEAITQASAETSMAWTVKSALPKSLFFQALSATPFTSLVKMHKHKNEGYESDTMFMVHASFVKAYPEVEDLVNDHIIWPLINQENEVFFYVYPFASEENGDNDNSRAIFRDRTKAVDKAKNGWVRMAWSTKKKNKQLNDERYTITQGSSTDAPVWPSWVGEEGASIEWGKSLMRAFEGRTIVKEDDEYAYLLRG